MTIRSKNFYQSFLVFEKLEQELSFNTKVAFPVLKVSNLFNETYFQRQFSKDSLLGLSYLRSKQSFFNFIEVILCLLMFQNFSDFSSLKAIIKTSSFFKECVKKNLSIFLERLTSLAVKQFLRLLLKSFVSN
uniref:Uncharacterized protein n=1 Tax=Ceramothamnion japonicum TaxID=218448 RepID=A0A0E3DBB7_CERJP|nr:hypothetical protein Cjap.mt.39 [Ceramium japonicum]